MLNVLYNNLTYNHMKNYELTHFFMSLRVDLQQNNNAPSKNVTNNYFMLCIYHSNILISAIIKHSNVIKVRKILLVISNVISVLNPP